MPHHGVCENVSVHVTPSHSAESKPAAAALVPVQKTAPFVPDSGCSTVATKFPPVLTKPNIPMANLLLTGAEKRSVAVLLLT